MTQYQIANIRINVSGVESNFFHMRMKEYVAKNIQESDINITYSNADEISLPKGRTIGEAHRWTWIDTQDNKIAAYQWHPILNKNISLIEADKDFSNVRIQLCDFENSYGISNERRCFFAIGEVFHYAILKTNGLVLHSSSIDYDGNAILFSAPSGTGKSTHTQMWENTYKDKTNIINDDTPAIRFVDNVPYAFGTPWCGKTEKNKNISAPIKAIVFLQRANENEIIPLTGAWAVSLMLNEVRKSVFPELMEQSLHMINKIISNVPVYQLSCNISEEAVNLVKNTLSL